MNKEKAMIRLRGHHLLCFLTWAGKGYTSAFTACFDMVSHSIKHGAVIKIVKGPDDLCQTLCPHNTPDYHCNLNRIESRDIQALLDLETLFEHPLSIGDHITLTSERIARMRTEFVSNNIRTACIGCEWYAFCTDIAKNAFKDTRLSENIG